MFIQFGKQFVK